MALEPIRRTNPIGADRAEVEFQVARAVETDPERFLAAYAQHPESFGGRYVCADLMKEVFPEYAESAFSRGRYNNVVHNSAAVLASEQYRRALADRSDPWRRGVQIITGTPGSGKTTLILGDGIGHTTQAVYEGQLLDPSARAKIGAAIDGGFNVAVTAVLPRIENAFDNTLSRFERIGRGASIAVMTRIHEGTPAGLAAIADEFGDQVEISIVDIRDLTKPHVYGMQDGLALWNEELGRGSTEQRLFDQLNRLRGAGRGSDDFDRQARGRPIEGREQGVAAPARSAGEAVGREPRGAAQDRGPQLLGDDDEGRRSSALPEDDGRYHGPIIAADAGTVTQLVDGEHVIHKRMLLTGKTGELDIGKTLAIDYRGGIGTVKDPQQITQGRGR